MKFKRTDEIEEKLFTEALINENNVIKDAIIHIVLGKGNKLKAYCQNTDTFLQFPRDLRELDVIYIADVIEVKNDSVEEKYYRVQKGTIRRNDGKNEVVG